MISNFTRALRACFTAALCAAAVAAPAQAQSAWPSRHVTIVVPFAAGGGADAVARLLALDLSARLGQPVVVDNKPGATGNIGTAAVAKAAPDGHTLLLTSPGPVVTSKLLYKTLPYDPERDLAPVMKLVESPFAMLVRADFPARDLQELIAWAKAHPGKLNVGTVGTGSLGHLLNLMVENHAKVKFNIVPYKGSAQVVTDLTAGHIDMTIDYPSTYFGQIAANKLRPVGSLGATRHALLSTVPTFSESGFKEIEATGWFALMGPAGIPAAVTQRLHREIAAFLNSPEAKAKLATLGYVPSVLSASDTKEMLGREMQRLAPIVRNANLSLD